MSCEKTPRPTYFLPSRPAHVACLCLTCVACELRTVAPWPRLRQRDCESTQHGKSSRVCWTDGTDGRVQAAKGSGSGWLPLRGPHLSRQTLPPSLPISDSLPGSRFPSRPPPDSSSRRASPLPSPLPLPNRDFRPSPPRPARDAHRRERGSVHPLGDRLAHRLGSCRFCRHRGPRRSRISVTASRKSLLSNLNHANSHIVPGGAVPLLAPCGGERGRSDPLGSPSMCGRVGGLRGYAA